MELSGSDFSSRRFHITPALSGTVHETITIWSVPANGTRPGVDTPFDRAWNPIVLRWKENGRGTRSRKLPSVMSTETNSGIAPAPSTRKNFGRIQVGTLLIHNPLSTRCISQSVTHSFCIDSKLTVRAFFEFTPVDVVGDSATLFSSGLVAGESSFNPAMTSRCRRPNRRAGWSRSPCPR